MQTALISLSLAFALSVGFNIWLALQCGKLSRKIADRDDTIDDMRSALGGVEMREDWRKQVL